MVGVSINFDLASLERRIEEVRKVKTRLAGAALAEGIEALHDATPQDSGFLAASWEIDIDGATVHSAPSDGEKEAGDMERPWRWSEKLQRVVPAEGLTFGEAVELSGPSDGSGSIYSQDKAAAAQAAYTAFAGRNKDMPARLDLRNTASYAGLLNEYPYIQNRRADNPHVGWAERARVHFVAAVKARLAQGGA